MDERLLAAPILIPLATAFFVPVVRRISHTLRALFCLVAMLLTLACLLVMAKPVFSGEIRAPVCHSVPGRRTWRPPPARATAQVIQ